MRRRVQKSNKKIWLTLGVLPFSYVVLWLMAFLLGKLVSVTGVDFEISGENVLFDALAMGLWLLIVVYSLWWIWVRKSG